MRAFNARAKRPGKSIKADFASDRSSGPEKGGFLTGAVAYAKAPQLRLDVPGSRVGRRDMSGGSAKRSIKPDEACSNFISGDGLSRSG